MLVLEGEACFAQLTGHHPAALEQQFGVGTQRERAQSDHPLRGGQPQRDAPGGPQRAHEVPMGQRTGRGEIHRTGQIAPVDQELDRADEVAVMDPGHILRAARDRPAQPQPHQPQQHIEDPAAVRAHHHGGPQRDLTGIRGGGLLLRPLPLLGDLDAERPVVRDAGLRTADLPVASSFGASKRWV